MLTEKMQKLIDDGYISMRQHPTQPLWILNYTSAAQINRMWTKETIQARGLIINEHGKVVSRPFKKFFNVEELSYYRNFLHHLYGVKYSEIFNQKFKVFEKLDGSLGVSYTDRKGRQGIATRGSFTSEQADVANKIFQAKYADFVFDKDKTYLFEIVYPANRIVVDYGDVEDLYLLAIVDNETGCDLEVPENLPFPRPKVYDDMYGFEQLSLMTTDNAEGFVLFFENGFRAKFKFEEYKRLHKIMTGVTPRRVLEVLKTSGNLDGWLSGVPDEFYQEIKLVANAMRDKYAAIENDAHAFCSSLDMTKSRKELAMQVGAYRHPSIVFNIMDHKDYSDKIWKLVEDTSVTNSIN